MNTDLWRQVKALHARALALPESERRAFVQLEAQGSAELASEVLALLAVDLDAAEERLRSPLSDDAAHSELIGSRIGGYRILEKIGSGGMGVVLLAESPAGKTVALKVLTRVAAFDPKSVERFHREISAIENLDHPGIVELLGHGEDKGTLYYAMEYIAGQSLGTVLARAREGIFGEPLDLRDHTTCAEAVSCILDALEHAHQNGVIHRDIKPDNIMVTEDGQPKIVDFGVARVIELNDLTATGDITGTPYYMSPEQAAAANQVIDHRSDLFSVSVMLYEMLTLRRPFEGTEPRQILQRIIHSEPVSLATASPGVSRPLAAVCHHALEKDPRYRFASAREFAATLRKAARGEAVVLQGEPWSRKLLRRVAQKPLAAVVITLTAAVVALIAVLFASMDREQVDMAAVHIDVAPGNGSYDVSLVRFDADPTQAPARETLDRDNSGPIDLQIPVGARFVRILVSSPGITREYSRELERNESVVIPAQASPALATSPMTTFSARQWTTLIGDQLVAVHVPAYEIDNRPVTNREYLAFLHAFQRADVLEKKHWDEAANTAIRADWLDLPATSMLRDDARAYAEWIGKRLPTAVEWEIAMFEGDGVVALRAMNLKLASNDHPMLPLSMSVSLSTYLEQAKALQDSMQVSATFGFIQEYVDDPVRAENSLNAWRFDASLVLARGASWGAPTFRDPDLQKTQFCTLAKSHKAANTGFRCARSLSP